MPTDPRKTRYRDKRLSQGSKEINLMLCAEAIAALDGQRHEAGLSRVKYIERLLLENYLPRS